jgi:hypothetical protein
MFIVGMIYDCALQRSGMSLSWVYIPLLTERAAANESPPINIVLLLRNSLRDLCVLCVSAVVECARPIFTAETQRTQRSRRESLRFIKLSACAKAALLRSEEQSDYRLGPFRGFGCCHAALCNLWMELVRSNPHSYFIARLSTQSDAHEHILAHRPVLRQLDYNFSERIHSKRLTNKLHC